MPLDRGAERLLRILSASERSAGPPTAPQRRRLLETLAEQADEPPAAEVATRELSLPGPAGPLRARLYAGPRGSAAGLVFFHGGGWVAGGLATHDGLCRRLAASSGVRILTVEYRLAPEHRFPAAIEDAKAAARWAADHAGELGFDPARLAIGGDSVGGGLAAVVAQDPDAPPLALQLLLCPVLDLAGESPSRRAFADGYFLDRATLAEDIRAYCGEAADLRDPRLSPALAAGQAPRTLIHAAEFDPFRDEAEEYGRHLGRAGTAASFTCWPGMIHYFYCLTRAIPSAGPAIEAIGAQLGDALA